MQPGIGIPAMKNAFKTLLIFPAVALLPTGLMAQDSEKKVNYLLYQNIGGYTVDYVDLNWKDGDKRGSKRYKKDLSLGKGFCVNLRKLNANATDSDGNPKTVVPEGAEVWLSYKIAGGDKQSCRKGKAKIFDPGKNGGSVYYLSRGTTLNGNRCRVDKGAKVNVASSSGNCPFDFWY